MKISRDKLNELMTLYLNDIKDYYNDESFILLAESSLPKVKTLLLESDKDIYTSLVEINKNTKGKSHEVMSDFITYIQNI